MNWEKDPFPFLLRYLNLFFLLVCLSLPGGMSHRVSSFLDLPGSSLFGLMGAGYNGLVFVCSSGLPGGLPLSHLQHPAASLGPSPRTLLDHGIYLLTCSIFSLSYSQVNSRLLQAALPEARGMPSVLGGGAGLLQRGACARTAATGIPASIPGSLQVGAGWLLFN